MTSSLFTPARGPHLSLSGAREQASIRTCVGRDRAHVGIIPHRGKTNLDPNPIRCASSRRRIRTVVTVRSLTRVLAAVRYTTTPRLSWLAVRRISLARSLLCCARWLALLIAPELRESDA